MQILHPGALYIHFFANICIISVYLMLLLLQLEIVDGPDSQRLRVQSYLPQLSIGMRLHLVINSWPPVPSVSVEYWHETQPNSQQLGYGLISLS